jgi:hypothetical protein
MPLCLCLRKQDIPSVPQFSVKIVNGFIEFTIENQPFTPCTDTNGYEHKLRYWMEFKYTFESEQEWKFLGGTFQSDSQYTTLTIPQWNLMVHGVDINSLPVGSQLDVRVKTETHYATRVFPDGTTYSTDIVIEASSDWNGVQTITKSGGIFSNPLFTLGVGVFLGIVVIAIVMMILRRHIKTPTYTNNTPQTNTNTEL